jgi:hypothetical protein
VRQVTSASEAVSQYVALSPSISSLIVSSDHRWLTRSTHVGDAADMITIGIIAFVVFVLVLGVSSGVGDDDYSNPPSTPTLRPWNHNDGCRCYDCRWSGPRPY